MQHREGHFTTPDGTDIYTQAWLPDDAPSSDAPSNGVPQAIMLIVHGLGDHSGRYGNYVDYFVPRGYALYGFDTRGHGRSSGVRGHVDRFDRYVEDLERRAAEARSDWPHAPLFVLAHSLGSLMGLSYARQHLDQLTGLIVTGTALKDALQLPVWKRQLATALSRVMPSLKMNNGIALSGLSHDPAVIAAYQADPVTHTWGTPRLATEAEVVRAQVRQSAPTWRVPTLMLHGGSDPICLKEGARQFAAQAPAGMVEYREYAGLYHEIHNEPEREQVFRDIEAWLHNRWR
ncbi:acylglycerol lipase [Thermoflexales bacterium]|nr:acylglycerol lipase [Thermoflexales bacterium]